MNSPSDSTTHLPTPDEAAKFAHMVHFIWQSREANEPRCATFDCQNASNARKLRRRLYYLRTGTVGALRERADKLAFCLQGRFVTVELLPEFQPVLTSGDKTHVPSEQPLASEGDRLDDKI